MDESPEPLTDRQERIIRRLARGFAARGLYRNSLDADDYFQAAYLRVWESRLAGGAMDDKLVYVVARDSMVVQDRQAFRAKRAYAAEAENPLRRDVVHPDASHSIDVADALARLPEGQRDALIAVYWLGMTLEEAAAASRTTRGAINMRLRTARQSMMDLIGEGFGEWARKCPTRYRSKAYIGRKYERTPTDRRAYQAAWRAKRKAEKSECLSNTPRQRSRSSSPCP